MSIQQDRAPLLQDTEAQAEARAARLARALTAAPWRGVPAALAKVRVEETQEERARVEAAARAHFGDEAAGISYEPPPPSVRPTEEGAASAAPCPPAAGMMLEAVEVERWSCIHREFGHRHLLPMDPKPFTNRAGTMGYTTLDEVPCPAQLQVLEGVQWAVVRCLKPGHQDEAGWFSADAFKSVPKILAEGVVMRPTGQQRLNLRVRLWLRRVGNSDAKLSDPSQAELPPRGAWGARRARALLSCVDSLVDCPHAALRSFWKAVQAGSDDVGDALRRRY